MHLNWIGLAANPSWLDRSIDTAAVSKTQKCEFKSRSGHRVFRFSLSKSLLKVHVNTHNSQSRNEQPFLEARGAEGREY